MRAQQSQVAYTTHGDGNLIVPLTIGVAAMMAGLIAFVAINMALVWILWAIHPVWGPFAYEFMWFIGLSMTAIAGFRYAFRRK
jgi:hypothetical protein